MLQQKLLKSGVPRRFIEARLSDFEDYFQDNSEAKAIIEDFIHNEGYWKSTEINGQTYWSDNFWRVLFLGGNVGTGKSHLLCAIAAEYSRRSYVKYTTAYAMSQDIMQARNSDAYKGCGLLIVDEIGRGFETESEKKRFFDLVDYRYANLSPIIFCGNVKKEDLREIVGEAVADRMGENMSFITLTGKSRRS